MSGLLADRSYVLLDGNGVEVARWEGVEVPWSRLELPNENVMFTYRLKTGRRKCEVSPGPLAAMVYRAMLELA